MGHPHIRDPNLSTPMPRHPTARSSLRAAPGAFPDTAWPGPARVRLGPDEDSTPRTSPPLQARGGGCARTAESPQETRSDHLGAFPETAPLLRATPAPGQSIPFSKNSELLTGPHSRQFDALREPTHNLSRALRRSLARAKSLGQKCPGASQGSGLRAPRWARAARAASVPRSCAATRGGEHGHRSAPERAPFHPGLTVSSAAAAGRQGTGRGRHNMAEHRSCSRQLPAAASGKTRQRAGSGSCGGGRGSTTSPSRSLPPAPSALPPAAIATRRQGD